MVIEEDCSAVCYECGKIYENVVPCATRDQYYANGGRHKTPYNRIKYFREWMSYILGYPTHLDADKMQKIKKALRNKEATPQNLKKVLRRLRIHVRGMSYLLSQITGKPIPDVSYDTMCKAEWMFSRIEGKIPYYPNLIYEIFKEIDPQHPILDWIPKKN